MTHTPQALENDLLLERQLCLAVSVASRSIIAAYPARFGRPQPHASAVCGDAHALGAQLQDRQGPGLGLDRADAEELHAMMQRIITAASQALELGGRENPDTHA